MGRKNARAKQPRSKALTVLGILLILCALVCGGILGRYAYDYYVADQAFSLIAQDFEKECEKEGSTPSKAIASLSAKNKDCVGWIRVKDTRINYPVMCTPDDPDYYLHTNFEKNYSFAGTPFLGDGCTITSNSIIVYGHHMNDGSMFAELTKFDSSSFAENHKITLITEKGEGSYEVVAAYYADLTDKDHYEYWNQVGDLDPEQLAQHVATMKSQSLYATDAKVTQDSKLLMLSTCTYGTRDERFVVLARKAS